MAKKVNLDVSERLDITCRRGDSFSLSMTLKDSAGTVLPLSTDKYRFAMQVRSGDASAKARGASGLIIGTRGLGARALNGVQEVSFEEFSVTDAGVLTITATPTTMRLVPEGSYVYDLQQIKPVTDSVDEHTTILRGVFKVNGDVSEASSQAKR